MKQIIRAIFSFLALILVGCKEPNYGTTPDMTIASLGTPEDNEIWFTTTDGRVLQSLDTNAFDAAVQEIIYSDMGVNVIRFANAVTEIGEEAFKGCFNIFNLSLPNSVQRIETWAFLDCKNMEAITLGMGLRSCGKDAFEGCYNLHSLHIPSMQSWCNITFATKWANPLYFAEGLIIDGESIKVLNIPDGVEQINSYAFIYNMQINSVKIPKTVTRIGKEAFEGCDNLKKVEIESLSGWCNIEFDGELANPLTTAMTLYEDGLELRDLSLTGVSYVSAYAFMNCTSIRSLQTDSSLLGIGKSAFRNCSELTSVELGEGVKEMQMQIFFNCEKLSSVTCRATTPPSLEGSNTFARNAENRKIFVPTTSLEIYKAEWSLWADAIEAIN